MLDVSDLALVGYDDLLLTLWELAYMERFLGMGQTGKFALINA